MVHRQAYADGRPAVATSAAERPLPPQARDARKLNTRGINLVLSRLAPADRERIVERCEKVSLKSGDNLYMRGERIAHVYFPLSGMVSLVLGSAEGQTIEVGVIGNEGMVGTAVSLGAASSHVHALIQAEGDFLRMTTEDFLFELKRNAALVDLTHRCTHALTIQISQSVMCNRMHPMEERMCRWLLMTHDRTGTDDILLTQEFISQMLGIRRPTVTVAAGLLQKAGFIDFVRGRVTVLDRTALEKASCECYRTVTSEVRRLMLQ